MAAIFKMHVTVQWVAVVRFSYKVCPCHRNDIVSYSDFSSSIITIYLSLVKQSSNAT